MGHGFHGYVSHNQRVVPAKFRKFHVAMLWRQDAGKLNKLLLNWATHQV